MRAAAAGGSSEPTKTVTNGGRSPSVAADVSSTSARSRPRRARSRSRSTTTARCSTHVQDRWHVALAEGQRRQDGHRHGHARQGHLRLRVHRSRVTSARHEGHGGRRMTACRRTSSDHPSSRSRFAVRSRRRSAPTCGSRSPRHRAAARHRGAADVPRPAGLAVARAGAGGRDRRRDGRGRRQHHQLLDGARPRPAHAPHAFPAAPAGRDRAVARAGVRHRVERRRVRAPRVGREPARGRAHALGDALLRVRVHAVAQAPHGAEHRDRRRGGCGSGARGLGRGARQPGAGLAALRRRVLLDAGALLGAGDEVPRRLRGGGHPDAARSCAASRRRRARSRPTRW